jgi:hypothetical protein
LLDPRTIAHCSKSCCWCSAARINRGFGIFARRAYPSILDELVQKGLCGFSLFLTIRIVAFGLLSFLISVSVVILASHRTFSAKASNPNLIPLLWVGSNSNFFSTHYVADLYASSSYLSVPRIIIWCTFNMLPWSAPHVICGRHFIIHLLSFQPIHLGVKC